MFFGRAEFSVGMKSTGASSEPFLLTWSTASWGGAVVRGVSVLSGALVIFAIRTATHGMLLDIPKKSSLILFVGHGLIDTHDKLNAFQACKSDGISRTVRS